jgi:hypothetical protein
VDYENLCNLDVLGLKDSPAGDQQSVYEEFKEQLISRPDGSYETGLPWRGCHPPLPNNELGSLRRLNYLAMRLGSWRNNSICFRSMIMLSKISYRKAL